ncbi:hypothetical protein [Actinokineospora enzanensis]|nr:hypothetical protein [Actinokineospora enzanensis]
MTIGVDSDGLGPGSFHRRLHDDVDIAREANALESRTRPEDETDPR